MVVGYRAATKLQQFRDTTPGGNPYGTFTGDMVDRYKGLIEIGTAGQNQARLNIGKPARIDVGDYCSNTIWSDNNKVNTVKTTDEFTITDFLQDGSKAYELLGNCYFDGTNFKSISLGDVWRIRFQKAGVCFETATSSDSNQIVDFTQKWAINDGQGPNGIPEICLAEKIITWDNKAPIGTYPEGSMVFNSMPAKGKPLGWVMTSKGWLPMPDL